MSEPQGPIAKFISIMTNIMRPMNFMLGCAVCVVGVLLFITKLFSATAFSFAVFRVMLNMIFTCFLGLLLLAGDIPRLTFIHDNCKFLIIYMGRGLFNIFVGGWIFGLHHVFSGISDNSDKVYTDGTVTIASAGSVIDLITCIVNITSPLYRTNISFLIDSLGPWRILYLHALRK